MADNFSLTSQIELVNEAASIDSIYDKYNSLEEAKTALDLIGLPGRQFVLNNADGTKVLYLYQGPDKEPTEILDVDGQPILKKDNGGIMRYNVDSPEPYTLGTGAVDFSTYGPPITGFKHGAVGNYSMVFARGGGAEGIASFVAGGICYSQGQTNHIISYRSSISEDKGSKNKGKYSNGIYAGEANEIKSTIQSTIIGGSFNNIEGNPDPIVKSGDKYTIYNAILGGYRNKIFYNDKANVPPSASIIAGGWENKAQGMHNFVTGYSNHAVTAGEALFGLYGTIQDETLSGFDYISNSRMFNVGVGSEAGNGVVSRKDGFSVYRNGLVTFNSLSIALINTNPKAPVTKEWADTNLISTQVFEEALFDKMEKVTELGDVDTVLGLDENLNPKNAKVVDVVGIWDANVAPTEQELIDNYEGSLFVYAVALDPVLMYLKAGASWKKITLSNM